MASTYYPRRCRVCRGIVKGDWDENNNLIRKHIDPVNETHEIELMRVSEYTEAEKKRD